MRKSATSRAEQQFTASKKKTDQALKDKDKAWHALEQKTARLKMLRLAKETSDREAAETAAAEKTAGTKEPKR